MSIRPLPKDVVDRIKSSSAITSLNQVVCGLLTNSLDACCTKVNISLDYVLGNCTVQDNGLGIEPSEFEQDGGLCKLHRAMLSRVHMLQHARCGLTLTRHIKESAESKHSRQSWQLHCLRRHPFAPDSYVASPAPRISSISLRSQWQGACSPCSSPARPAVRTIQPWNPH